MYTSCAFCSGPFGGDGATSGLGVGRRFAYDGWKSRAWVICLKCRRWNLTPFDTRLDTITALDRMAAPGRVVATSEQVALIRVGPYDVVRVGKPPRVEMATWRYGERLKARQRERLKVVVPVSLVVIGATIAFNALAFGSMGAFIGQVPSIADSIYTGMVGNRKVNIEPPICAHCGKVLVLKAKHVERARLQATARSDLALLLDCPHCKHEAALLEGTDAQLALRHGLTYVNLRKGKKIKKKAEEAAQRLDQVGGPDAFIYHKAREEALIKKLGGGDALALEMAVDEQAELRELERQWREADEIAEIADGLLLNPDIERRLDDLRHGGG